MGQSTSRSVAALVNKSEPIFQLNEAIKTKNLTVVNELSSVWIDIIEVYRQPGTEDPAIHQALRLGWEDGVMILLSGIGDSNIPSHVDQLGDNPVHLAIRGSFSKALNIFRGERKCFPWFNLKNTAGVTPNALLSVPTMPQNFPFPNHWISPDSLTDIAPLSEGGYAKIFKATQAKPDPSRPVVIKAIHMDSKQKAIPREATLLLSFPHPNIIDLLGVTHLPDRRIELALVLPFSPLGDVEQWMQANPESSLDVRFEIVLQIAQGLHHLHLHGVFHNDLKPQNVILFPHDDGQSLVAKLIDFGISYTDGAAFESTPVISPSTQQYCAPERSSFAARLQPENKPSAATDTYSFGQTAFFICRELRDSRFHPIWSKFLNSCTNDNPRLRPNSFQPLFVHAPPPPASFYWPDIWIPAEWVRKDDVPLSAGAQCEIYRGYLIDVFPDSSSPLIKQDAFPKSGSGNTSQLASPSASNTFSFLLGASPSIDGVSSVGPSESGSSCAKEIRVALKLVHTNQTHERPLLREISLLTRSGNKPHNIIPLYGATLLNNQICLITPLSEIGDLHTWLKHRLPILAKAETDPEPVKALDGLLVYIISGIARGVKSLHDMEIIHNDLKPQNVVLFPSDRNPALLEPMLIDFGLSYSSTDHLATALKAYPSPQDIQKSCLDTLATIQYTAPERLHTGKVAPPPSIRSDLYSFGATAYHIYHAQPLSRTPRMLYSTAIEALPESPHRFFSPELIRFINQCIHRDPEQRPVDMSGFPFHPFHGEACGYTG